MHVEQVLMRPGQFSRIYWPCPAVHEPVASHPLTLSHARHPTARIAIVQETNASPERQGTGYTASLEVPDCFHGPTSSTASLPLETRTRASTRITEQQQHPTCTRPLLPPMPLTIPLSSLPRPCRDERLKNSRSRRKGGAEHLPRQSQHSRDTDRSKPAAAPVPTVLTPSCSASPCTKHPRITHTQRGRRRPAPSGVFVCFFLAQGEGGRRTDRQKPTRHRTWTSNHVPSIPGEQSTAQGSRHEQPASQRRQDTQARRLHWQIPSRTNTCTWTSALLCNVTIPPRGEDAPNQTPPSPSFVSTPTPLLVARHTKPH